MNIIDTLKSKVSGEASQLKASLEEMTKDRDATLLKLKEFEEKNKDYIESAQTAEQMKEAHNKAIESLKAEYEQKVADKDKEITKVKESVVSESIKLVASQSTDVVIPSAPAMGIEEALVKLNTLTGKARTHFYAANKKMFEDYIKHPSKATA